MRLILYARKSTDREDRQIQSIPDQIRLLRELAERYNIPIVREISESRSAKTPLTRPGFQELLRALNEGEADGVLCWSVSRMFRNQLEYGMVQQMLQDRTIEVVRTIEREYRPEDNVLLMAVEAGLATQYSRDLSRDVIRGLTTRREAGWYTSRVPEGYVNNRQDRRVDVDPDRFYILQESWRLMLTGAYSVPKILEFLDSRSYMMRRSACRGGRPLRRNILYSIFTNPFYAGYFVINGQRYEGAHEPMVSADEFKRVQEILRNRSAPQASRPNLLFSGFIRCARCGGLVTGERKVKHYPRTRNTRTYTYYHCNGYRGCSKRGLPEDVIAREVEALIECCDLDPALSRWADQGNSKTLPNPTNGDWQTWRAKRQQAHLLRAKLIRVQEMREDGELSRREFEQRKHQLSAELAETEEELRSIEGEARAAQDSVDEASRCLQESRPRWKSCTANEKRPMLMRLGEFFLTLEGLNIRLNPLLKKMLIFEPGEITSGTGKNVDRNCDGLDWWHVQDHFLTLARSEEYRFPSLPRRTRGSLTPEELRDVGVPISVLVEQLRSRRLRIEAGTPAVQEGLVLGGGLLEVVQLQDGGGELLSLMGSELDAVELQVESTEGPGVLGASDGEGHERELGACSQPEVRRVEAEDSLAA